VDDCKIMTVKEYAVSRGLNVKSVYAWIRRDPVPHNVSCARWWHFGNSQNRSKRIRVELADEAITRGIPVVDRRVLQ
jgi:hypothetical protein